LKRGSLNSLLELAHYFTDTTVLSNDNADEPTFSSCDLSTRKKDR
jgi:hypothetical protein